MLDLLDKHTIQACLSHRNLEMLNKLLVFDELPSTNDYLIEHAKQYERENAVCFAERQTAGRGRLGRKWVSPFAANIYMSLLWQFSCNISELAGLNVVVGIAIAEAIQDTVNVNDIKLKWPNDIIWQDRKLGGVLIEIIGEYNGGCRAVIGIGVNVNMSDAHADEINKPWTDLYRIAGHQLSRGKFAGVLLDKLITNLLIFQAEGIARFIQIWHQRDYLFGKEVIVKSAVKSQTGIVKGISKQGHLILQEAEGDLATITTGDASILMP